MSKNPALKFRDDRTQPPYLTVKDEDGPFGPTEFRVLKVYQVDPHKPYARVMVRAISGATGSGGDLGDAYWGDVRGTIVQHDPVLPLEMIPSHLKGGPMQASTLDGVMDELLGPPTPPPAYPGDPATCTHGTVMLIGLTTQTGTCQICGATVKRGGFPGPMWVRVDAQA